MRYRTAYLVTIVRKIKGEMKPKVFKMVSQTALFELAGKYWVVGVTPILEAY